MDRSRALLTQPTRHMRLAPSLRPFIATAILGSALVQAPAAAAAPDSPSPRVINGTAAPAGKWPAQGYLEVGGAACGGTLVSGRWFLTAAHCAFSNSVGDYRVTLGKANLSAAVATDRFAIDKGSRHEQYVPGNFANDLALLHLSRPTAPPIQPLRLVAANEPSLWVPGTIAAVLGWGITTDPGFTTSQLQEATVPIVDDATCNSTYGRGTSATVVCAGGGVTDTCQGDSGGPLMVPRQGEFVLVGVTSFGVSASGCATPGVASGYARVGAPALNQWIRARIPTVFIGALPAVPRVGDTVQLTATGVKPADQPGTPTTAWDLDANGTYETPGATVSIGAPPQGSYPVAVEQTYPDGDRAQSREIVTVGGPLPPPAATSAGTSATSINGPPPFAAKLELARAEVRRSARRLSVLAPITARASGEVKTSFRAAGRTERFTAEIDADKRRVRINRSIGSSQARLGTGILTLTYPGDDDTQPQEVRLRAASQKANLDASRPKLSGSRLTADGKISRRARGVVRLQLLYEPPGQSTRTLEFTAPIKNGRYSFDERLPADVVTQIGQRRGVVHSYTLFTGYYPRRVRGEMSSYRVLGRR